MQARGSKISRATVYRNLDLLVECGLARKQQLASRRFLYEHVHGGQYHDHLVCAVCGIFAVGTHADAALDARSGRHHLRHR